eukprot:7388947-Prymnesium_polylepis.1
MLVDHVACISNTSKPPSFRGCPTEAQGVAMGRDARLHHRSVRKGLAAAWLQLSAGHGCAPGCRGAAQTKAHTRVRRGENDHGPAACSEYCGSPGAARARSVRLRARNKGAHAQNARKRCDGHRPRRGPRARAISS